MPVRGACVRVAPLIVEMESNGAQGLGHDCDIRRIIKSCPLQSQITVQLHVPHRVTYSVSLSTPDKKYTREAIGVQGTPIIVEFPGASSAAH